ncbi:MAG: hypothetical protein FD123_996 [Bacteroidetes bacterium]|nr:MAG: hypothetical protein FD123_996 [Bacteroidota bacterium]
MTKAALKSEIELALQATENQVVLELVYSILRGDHAPVGKRISRKQYNKELKKAIEQGKEGKYRSHSDLEKELSKW